MRGKLLLPIALGFATLGAATQGQSLLTTFSKPGQKTEQTEQKGKIRVVNPKQNATLALGNTARRTTRRKVDARPNVADAPVIYGLKHADAGYNDVSGGPYNVIRFHAAEGTAKKDVSPEIGGTTAFYARGKFYTLEMDGTQCILKTYDAETWALESTDVVCEKDDFLRQVAAFDETTGKAYFVFWGEMDWDTYKTARPLMELDLETKQATEVGKIDQIFVQTMFFDNEGQLYGIPYNTKELYKISKTDGSLELAATLDIPFGRYPNSECAFTDPASGVTYWIVPRTVGDGYNAESYIYTIDCKTGECKFISDMPNDEHLQGAYVKYAPAAAPAAATGITYGDGKLSFTAPTTTYTTGEALSGTLNANILVDGKPVSKAVTPGEAVEVPVTLMDGDHEICITISNAAGNGPERIWEGYLGEDQPTAVTDLTATLEGSTVTLSWTAPAASLNGGAFNDADVRYDVARYPDMKLIASGISETSIKDELPNAHAHYTYEVISYVGEADEDNQIATSNEVIYGSVWVPDYTEQFICQDDWALFTVIDNNSDGNGWIYMESQQNAYLMGNGAYDPDFNPNGGKGMDDYLITPSIELKKGVEYRLTFDALEVGLTHEYLNVYVGQGNTVGDMKTKLAEYDLSYTDDNTGLANNFSVEEEGLYNIGFHSCAPQYSTNYSIDNISIEVYAYYDAPAASTEVTATAGANGALTNTLTFTLPTKTYDGDELKDIEYVTISRNGEVISTLFGTSYVPGATITYVDEKVANGEQNYTIVAYNSVGQGAPATVTNWVGIDIPEKPEVTECHMTADIKPAFSWKAVSAVGAHGGLVVPGEVTYTLCKYNPYAWDGNNWEAVATTTDLSAIDDTYYSWYGQAIETYAVFASNEGGISEGAMLHINLGTPWETPYEESFAWAFASKDPWTLQANSYDYAWKLTDGAGLAVKPYDGDGGMLYYTYVTDDSNEQVMQGPRIALGALTKAELSFYMYHGVEADPEDVTLEVWVNYNDAGWQRIGTVDYNNGATGWARSSFALETPAAPEGYAASNVQIAFRGITAVPSASIFIDKIAIADGIDTDAALVGLSGTKRLNAGDEQTLSVAVANYGMKDLDYYNINFEVTCAEDPSVSESFSIPGDILAPGEVMTTEYAVKTLPKDAGRNFEVVAYVEADGDANLANDTLTYKYYVKGSNLPAATDLAIEQDQKGVELSWTAPATDEVTDPVTDGFDDYESFIIEGIGDWKVYDGDGAIPVYFGGPSIAHDFEAKAWQVWAPEEAGFSLESFPVLTPHSGAKYLSSWTASDGVSSTLPTDDWLISSDVQGGSDVSFYYRVPNAGSDAQNVELLYSNTDQQVESFQHVDGDEIVGTTEWVKLEYTLPQDAKYFAVRNWNNGGATTVSFLDDIEYTPLYGATTKLTFKGYNIYRDGKLIASNVQETAYTDEAAIGDHEYYVTAVWAEGESNPSNIVEIEVITSLKGIELAGEPAEIYSVDGRLIKGEAEPGVYILRQGEKTTKVIIK